jgi:hypothetical protein
MNQQHRKWFGERGASDCLGFMAGREDKERRFLIIDLNID